VRLHPDDDTENITIQRPTISGFCGGNAFWNLGPGTADPQPTSGGSYTQSVALTFNSNCGSCTSTPNWTLAMTNAQTQLPGGSTSATGSTTTISKGSGAANCLPDSVLSRPISTASRPSTTPLPLMGQLPPTISHTVARHSSSPTCTRSAATATTRIGPRVSWMSEVANISTQFRSPSPSTVLR
jgi:hypothetical protein